MLGCKRSVGIGVGMCVEMWGKMWESFAWGKYGEICWSVGEVRREVGKGVGVVGKSKERCGGVKKCGERCGRVGLGEVGVGRDGVGGVGGIRVGVGLGELGSEELGSGELGSRELGSWGWG